ncbi:MAG: hypothetical protein EKK39_06370 [Sphingobacteriales bacterium]|uniref:D-alanyl-D-alanine carboxypeptidase/D-alanyl-D-alanine-endopeptidase n=1 Tax=Hydrotalea flava TaxID=714549 RepID=UPI00082E9E93|nr:D-alanyl-D-alanine carboxypeptidase [Hydrotalea flava]RTL52714.1 MAG: hypothetical protein EKK39_06370 [Sphingobacteriales bacterium]
MEIKDALLQRLQTFLTIVIAITWFSSCITHKKIQAAPANNAIIPQNTITTQTIDPFDSLLENPALKGAQVGICIANADSGNYLFQYQADKYFIPASNMKLLTCYAAMQYLGDSLTALRYVDKGYGTIEVEPNGDPTFLISDFANQPVYQFLKQQKNILITTTNWKDNALGAGWAWDDYTEDYMAERSAMPVYGNVATFTYGKVEPAYFQDKVINPTHILSRFYAIKRNLCSNHFEMIPSGREMHSVQVPFFTAQTGLLEQLLTDTLHVPVTESNFTLSRLPDDVQRIHSQPTDSLLKIMMHRSDNFFAEQSLLMVSNELLGEMNDKKIISKLLETDFATLPQKPKWIDGSGLSRYNLITPADLVTVLQKMKSSFGMTRISAIFPSANAGTLSGYYQPFSGNLFAKTGTLSNHLAISGYVTTASGKPIVFSVLVNNHVSSATAVRRAVENYLTAFIRSH